MNVYCKMFRGILPKITILLQLRTSMNGLDVEVKRSNVKVMSRPNMARKEETYTSTANRRVLSSYVAFVFLYRPVVHDI